MMALRHYPFYADSCLYRSRVKGTRLQRPRTTSTTTVTSTTTKGSPQLRPLKIGLSTCQTSISFSPPHFACLAATCMLDEKHLEPFRIPGPPLPLATTPGVGPANTAICETHYAYLLLHRHLLPC